MDPQDIEQAARERYNAVSETFWSQSEIFTLIRNACQEAATETQCIEGIDSSTTTVSGTQGYAFPTNFISIKRLTYDGIKLSPIDFRKADSLTLNNTSTELTGRPDYYVEWGGSVYLYPTPNDAKVLKFWGVKEPAAVTALSTIEIPSVFHGRIINYVLSEMYAKDKDFQSAQYYKGLWNVDKKEMSRWLKRARRRDSFATVIDEESLPNTILGFK
jgi:hypothetical protein